jgi:hypothetical protein
MYVKQNNMKIQIRNGQIVRPIPTTVDIPKGMVKVLSMNNLKIKITSNKK